MKIKITASMLILLGLVGCGGGGDSGGIADTTTGGGTTTGGTTTGGTTTGGTTTGGTTTVTMSSRLSTTVGRSIGIKADGTVLAWGAGGGVSISGDPVAGTAAKQVSGLPAVAAVSVANAMSDSFSPNYGLAVSADGRVFGWGNGNKEGLSFGAFWKNIYSAPTQIDQLTGISQIKATPAGFTVAAKSDGTLWVLGGPATGILSAATMTGAKLSAKQVTGVSGIVYIGGGISSSVVSADSASVVDNVGRVYIVYVKQLTAGLSGGDFAETSVEQVNGLPAISKVSCAALGSSPNTTYHCLALAVDGKVWSWGTSGSKGEIGDGGTSGRTIPVLLSGISGIVDVATTTSNSFAVDGSGKTYSWGDSSSTALGRSAAIGGNLTPAEVLGVSDVVEIAAGGFGYFGSNVLVRTKSGSVWGWGDNKNGELGDGSTQSASKPVQAVGINLN